MARAGLATPSRRRFWGWLALLVGVSLLVRWLLVWDAATVTPDGAEYLAIARSLRETGRYATDLKWQFYSADPVRHAAWVDRPPLYPAFAALCAGVLPGLDPVAAARVGNVVLSAAAQILAALYLRRLFGPSVALAAVGYVFLLPHTVYWTSQPLTEALTLFLTLGVLLMWAQMKEGGSWRVKGGGWRGEGGETPEGGEAQGGDPPRSHLAKGGSPEKHLAAAGRSGQPAFVGIALIGVLCGLAYLTRPTGALLLAALLLDLLWREKPSTDPGFPREKPAPRWKTVVPLLAGYLMTVAPYHWMLWKTAGSPFASALGFTFTITTIHDVTVLGFERIPPGLLTFLRDHGAELPGLIGKQAASHAQGLLLPLLGLLPLLLWVRRSDFQGMRRAGFLLVLLLMVTHTLTWSAKGSSRYFLFCLLLLAALAIGNALSTASFPKRYAVAVLLSVSAIGLGVELCRFIMTQARPDHGLAGLPAWKAAAERVRDAELIASDQPWILNLLAERPAVMLPRTSDPEKLGRFIDRYRPDVLILFPDEPAERGMRDAWRADMLPAGWRVVHAQEGYLEVRREQR